MFRDAGKGQFEWRNTIAPLLGDWVVLLAMKHRRAPLPVSSGLWKGLLREGFPNDLDELAILARRYLFLGDARMLLAELRNSNRRNCIRARDIVKRGQDQSERSGRRSRMLTSYANELKQVH